MAGMKVKSEGFLTPSPLSQLEINMAVSSSYDEIEIRFIKIMNPINRYKRYSFCLWTRLIKLIENQ